MNINANIETADTVREKVKTALGFDCASALDLVRREDFADDGNTPFNFRRGAVY